MSANPKPMFSNRMIHSYAVAFSVREKPAAAIDQQNKIYIFVL